MRQKNATSIGISAHIFSSTIKLHFRKGHELRTMEAVLHWNELKRDEANGTRIIVSILSSIQFTNLTHSYQIGKKSHYNNTLKKHVFRNVKSTAKNAWRETVKNKCYEVW